MTTTDAQDTTYTNGVITAALGDLLVGESFVRFVGDDVQVVRAHNVSWDGAKEVHTAITYQLSGFNGLAPSSGVVVPTGAAALRLAWLEAMPANS